MGFKILGTVNTARDGTQLLERAFSAIVFGRFLHHLISGETLRIT